MSSRAVALATSLLLLTARFTSAEILGVSHRPEIFDPRVGQSVVVRFHLSQPAKVTLTLFDARDLEIRKIASSSVLPSGDHDIAWDGCDGRGEPVPSEAYTYALDARGPDGEAWRWDVSAFAGDPVEISDLAWDAKTGAVRYRIVKTARLRIRVGLGDGGPLLRTLVDWVPRARGSHAEPWDGRDASAVLSLAHHPALVLDGSAFELPRNAILVGPPAAENRFISDLPAQTVRRARGAAPRHQMLDYARQAVEQRQDFPVVLSLPEGLSRTRDGVPIVREPVPVRLELTNAALARAVDERSEAVFFVDGRFVFERESGFLPITWTWDPAGHATGLHHLTANVRGYEGHFGIGTTPVWVEAPASPKEP